MKRDIDWGILLNMLVDKTNETPQTIGEKIGGYPRYITCIMLDKKPVPEQWNQSIELLDLFLKHFNGTDVPRVGDYYAKDQNKESDTE